MEIFNSENFGPCPQPKSFQELTELIIGHDYDHETFNVKVWRGQADISWGIHSSGYRRILNKDEKYKFLKDRNEDLKNYEKRLLDHATHQGYRQHNGRTISDMELLARLQHHGAATRLVDVSRNAFIALWFCVSTNSSKTGVLIGLHTNALGGIEAQLEDGSYDEVIKICEQHDHPQVYESPSISPRIFSQHGQFLYSKVSSNKEGSLDVPQEDKYRTFIAITPELKQTSINVLESVFDYRTKTLFPDLDGFGMANHFSVPPDKMDRW